MATQYVHGEVGFGACVVVTPGHPTAVPAGFPLLGAAEVWTGVCPIGKTQIKMLGTSFCHPHSMELRHSPWDLPLGTCLSGYPHQHAQELGGGATVTHSTHRELAVWEWWLREEDQQGGFVG